MPLPTALKPGIGKEQLGSFLLSQMMRCLPCVKIVEAKLVDRRAFESVIFPPQARLKMGLYGHG